MHMIGFEHHSFHSRKRCNNNPLSKLIYIYIHLIIISILFHSTGHCFLVGRNASSSNLWGQNPHVSGYMVCCHDQNMSTIETCVQTCSKQVLELNKTKASKTIGEALPNSPRSPTNTFLTGVLAETRPRHWRVWSVPPRAMRRRPADGWSWTEPFQVESPTPRSIDIRRD